MIRNIPRGSIIMKIAVIGAGAVGSVIGGLLSKSGEDVTLIGRKPHVDAINQNGLILKEASGESIIRVRATENLDFKPDLALLSVKTQDVESSVKKAQSYLSSALVVTVQNGIQSDELVARIIGEEKVISSVITSNNEFLKPGIVLYSNTFGKTVMLIGEPFGTRENRLQGLLTLFNKALPTDISKNIRGAHWTKLMWNLQTAVPAITGFSYQDSYQYPQVRKLSVMLIKEGLKVINIAGIKTEDVPGFPLEPLKTISSLLLKRKAKSLGEIPVLGSMLQSIMRGSTTEVDYINGEIVNLGMRVGIPTPANSLIVELVHQVETDGKFLTIDEISKKLR
jgi:2-dehydropantoate 2-reductase